MTCGTIRFVVRKCVLSIARSTAESFILISLKMSNHQDKGKQQAKQQAKEQAKQQELMTYVQPRMKSQALTSNVSTATFSSMSKQAESLVNGGNNVVFNPYNNNLVFQWVSMSMNDCLSIDLFNRALLNLMCLKFVSKDPSGLNAGGEIRGISDGFTVGYRQRVMRRRGGSTLRLNGDSLILRRC